MKDKSKIKSILLKQNEDGSCSVEIKDDTGTLSLWAEDIDYALIDLFLKGKLPSGKDKWARMHDRDRKRVVEMFNEFAGQVAQHIDYVFENFYKQP